MSRNSPSGPTSAAPIPSFADMRRAWRADRCVQDSSAGVYLLWIRRFRGYCAQRGLDERAELTLDGVHRFVVAHARRHRGWRRDSCSARSALYALTRVYQVQGQVLPAWQSPRLARPPATALLRAYADHLARHGGKPEATVHKRVAHAGTLLAHLARQGKTWRTITLSDIDAFLVAYAARYARPTTADMAGTIRSFTRFLLATGRIAVDLAESVMAPVSPRYERPRCAWPWADVQRLLRAIDTASARGLRDHALLLMMSAYGLGAGEVIGLQLSDVDWSAHTLRVVRPKTGAVFLLPLLPAVAKVLARYLRYGRPPHTPTRHLFIRMKMPFGPLGGSSAVRHILIKHARAAGIEAPYLGSHVLRHSYAARQIDVGTSPQVLSDLLGHQDPESLSAYVRIATKSLREISLPVPT